MSESADVIHRLRHGGYNVRSKEQWGSKHLGTYAQRLRSKPFDLPAKYGFVHITVTGVNGDAGMRLVEEIGFERFGSGASYNWAVDHESDHTIYVGQPLGAKGTHTVNDKNIAGFPNNLNLFGHAVAFMGNVQDVVCDDCVDAIAAVFAAEQLEDSMRHGAGIYPHRKFAQKSCPGDKLAARMDDLVALVAHKVHVGDVKAGGPHEAKAQKPAPKKPAKKAAPPSRVEQARDLLVDAKKAAKAPSRKKKIDTALNDLPKE